MPDLALRDQVLDRAGDLFYRHVGIDSVLVEQIDRLDAQASEGGVGGLPDQVGPAGQGRSAGRVDLPELRGDDDLITNGGERVSHELLVGERSIGLRRVEERHAEVRRLPDQRNRLVPVQSGAAVVAQAHAAKPERRYLQPARPEHPLLQGMFHAFNRTTIDARGGDDALIRDRPAAAMGSVSAQVRQLSRASMRRRRRRRLRSPTATSAAEPTTMRSC